MTMGTEIEYKFLVIGDAWRKGARKILIRQGYLNKDKERTVRVRAFDNMGFLTVKGPSRGGVRAEFEYEIPFSDALEILDNLAEKPLIEKVRHIVQVNNYTWEIDEFMGANKGLIVAEIELSRPDQDFFLPHWVGKNVSDDPRYLNSNLAKTPYSNWKE